MNDLALPHHPATGVGELGLVVLSHPKPVHITHGVEPIALGKYPKFVTHERAPVDDAPDPVRRVHVYHNRLDLGDRRAEDQLHVLLAHVGEQVDAHARAPSASGANGVPLETRFDLRHKAVLATGDHRSHHQMA